MARDLNRGEAGRPHTYGTSWFTEFVASTEKRTTRQFQSTAKRIDLAAIMAGQSVRGYFGGLLSRDISHLEALISELESKITAQRWASSRVKEGYKCVVSFCKDVRTRKMKTKDLKNPESHTVSKNQLFNSGVGFTHVVVRV